jgi:3-deoxy-7-phosphoheptulonate synthase
MIPPLQNVNVESTVALVAPADLKGRLAVTKAVAHTVQTAREIVKQILAGEDKRLMVVVGPCSIHDRDACFEYAQRLQALSARVADRLFLVMRVYFEKPRTTVGWKGLINDPHLNDTFDIQNGLTMAREFLLDVAELGLPAATEMLEPITPQYISDLITVASIGARTTESPTHRQMASGLSMPVGYKNGTDGSLQVALDAMFAAQTPHSFLGIDGDGKTCIVNTRGNPWGHLILRGGRSGPNYDAEHLADAAARLKKMDLSPRLLVDCSHANSKKDYTRQGGVFTDVIEQRLAGNESITGLMLESHLNPGRQDLTSDLTQLKRGVSITDACIGWEETESLIAGAYERLSAA